MPAAAVEPRPGCKSIIPDGSYWLHWGNRRDDRWGGSLENRAQILLKTIDAIRQRVAPIFCVTVKVNSADFQRGGWRRAQTGGRPASGERLGVDGWTCHCTGDRASPAQAMDWSSQVEDQAGSGLPAIFLALAGVTPRAWRTISATRRSCSATARPSTTERIAPVVHERTKSRATPSSS